MLDLVIENARIVDGTGRPSTMGTLGAAGGVITYLGTERGLAAKHRVDAGGLVLAPGFIDPHTHYDAQIAWDSLLTSSPWHGVTTVVMGNCGVGVAPVRPDTRDILMHDLVNVEAIPYDVMQAGIAPEYVYDFPNKGRRLISRAEGVMATYVAGEQVFERGVHTGALAGRVLRSHES
jgi:N-acyl-D-amino-acid deacylase